VLVVIVFTAPIGVQGIPCVRIHQTILSITII
jgi:hypothetical protein